MRMATGDLKPDLVLTLSGSDPVNVTSATGVRILGKHSDQLIFDRTPDETDIVGDTSVLTMYWVDGDTDNIGRIQVEVEVTWPAGKLQTFRAAGGVDIYRDFDQLGLVNPLPPDPSVLAADEFVNTVLNLHADSWTTITDEIATRLAELVGSAPSILDTLEEIALALGNDPNLATSIANVMAGKQPIDGDLTDIAALTPTNNDIIQRVSGSWVNRTMAQLKTTLALVKGDVGLPNVDNTSDANKPVSAAQAAADLLKVDKTSLGLPSYVTTVANPYNPSFNAYNFKPTNTRLLRRGLARAAVGQLCEIVVAGDSSVTGAISVVGPTFDRLRAWPMQMRDELARHGIPTAGTGIVRLNDAQSSDARWGVTGSWLNQRLTYSYTQTNGATATFTSNMAGDRVTIGYLDDGGGGTFTVTVNGVSQGTTTQNGGTASWKKVTFNAAIAPTQTVVITKTSSSATFMYIRGVTVWNSTGGLLVHNIGQGGSKAYGTGVTFDDNTYWQDATDLHTLGQVFASPTASLTNPDCVFLAVGANDVNAGVSNTNIAAGLTAVRNRYPSSDFILVATQQIAAVADATHEAFVASLYTLADTLNVPLIDQRARLGNWTTIVANGINGDTQAHLKVEAFADLGRSVGQLLAT